MPGILVGDSKEVCKAGDCILLDGDIYMFVRPIGKSGLFQISLKYGKLNLDIDYSGHSIQNIVSRYAGTKYIRCKDYSLKPIFNSQKIY